MSHASIPIDQLKRRGWGETSRRDSWWAQPLAVFLGLLAFLVYANVRVFEGRYYSSAEIPAGKSVGSDYLTPFYSPLMFDAPGLPASGHAWLGQKPAWLPSFVSAAALILIFPAGFRLTCYYYRGAYYKAFWADPPNCAVGEPRKTFWGENTFPLLIQNIHRYTMYFAVIFIFILLYDAWKAFWFTTSRDGLPLVEGRVFGAGLGSLILLINPILLGLYTFGCHSLRHLVGGGRDHLAEAPGALAAYRCVSCLNRKHMLWAWCSLIWVAFTDIYVRQVASGAWTDLRFF